jgi:hypothetical protein
VKQKCLQNRGTQSAQAAIKRPDNQKVARAPRPEANDFDVGRAQLAGENAPGVETKDVRLPAPTVEARYDLDEGPLGPAGVEIGDAKGDARG